jgi:hypothetical protein
LFDAGLLTIAVDFKIQVSEILAGTTYAALAGTKIRLPFNSAHHPSTAAINDRNAIEFRA